MSRTQGWITAAKMHISFDGRFPGLIFVSHLMTSVTQHIKACIKHWPPRGYDAARYPMCSNCNQVPHCAATLTFNSACRGWHQAGLITSARTDAPLFSLPAGLPHPFLFGCLFACLPLPFPCASARLPSCTLLQPRPPSSRPLLGSK